MAPRIARSQLVILPLLFRLSGGHRWVAWRVGGPGQRRNEKPILPLTLSGTSVGSGALGELQRDDERNVRQDAAMAARAGDSDLGPRRADDQHAAGRGLFGAGGGGGHGRWLVCGLSSHASSSPCEPARGETHVALRWAVVSQFECNGRLKRPSLRASLPTCPRK